MEGITILSVAEQTVMGQEITPLSVIFAIVFGVAALCTTYTMFHREDERLILLFFLLVVGGVAAILISGRTEVDSYAEYKVTISDSVSYNEFVEQYEVIDQEGLIFTVKEREKGEGH